MPQQIEAGKVRNGTYVIIEDKPCEVRSVSKSSPGKHGSAKAKIKAKGLFDGKNKHITKPVDSMMMSPDVENKVGQIVSKEDDIAQVMDMDTYETEEMQLPEGIDVSEGEEIEYKDIEGRKLFEGVKD